MNDHKITFRYEPTPPDLERFARCPHYSHWREACVYEFLDAYGRHLYIGRSTHLRERMRHHARNSPWYPRAAHLIVNRVASWAVACKLEQRMIRELKPLHNIPAGGATRRRWEAYRARKAAVMEAQG